MSIFIVSMLANLILIFVSLFIFKAIIRGPMRHKIYEKLMSSFAKFVIFTFLASAIITSAAAYIMYRTRYIAYVNIVAPALVSILVGFIASTVPVKGVGEEDNKNPNNNFI
ncbi:hypothetical protein IAI10_03485 [Clostridium sp. 19966]|uniref:hypothetical protein n=1 Tax=Clostridium sp. 19966 TaxID=2768166 RepID=UPI0028DE4770|nr:hypothetical protein [Clostridium sp. 19966]MDT8715718.1 hypothetical protein [Clostridium sp. 19966]